MHDRTLADQEARGFFEDLWAHGDQWELDSSDFERVRCERLMALIEDRQYANVLELGCGTGSFTRLLARVAQRIVAIDIASNAIERARAAGPDTIDYRVTNIMEYDPHADGPWDLVVLSETIYYLGWLYPFCDIAWLASELFAATCTGGRLLLANTESGVEDGLIRPWIIRTYHDLFRNVGYQLDQECTYRGTKHGVVIDVQMSRFEKRQGDEGGIPGG